MLDNLFVTKGYKLNIIPHKTFLVHKTSSKSELSL